MGKTDKPEKNNNKKQKHFWKDFKAELKKVIWPTKSQVVNNTIIVIVIVIIVTALCFILDLAFEALNTYGVDKLKSVVQNSASNTVVDGNTLDNNTTADNTATNEITNNIDEGNTTTNTNETENNNTVDNNAE